MKKFTRLAYISPKFPSLSLVFEQNEILGIYKSNIELEILSCRQYSADEQHSFVTPLLSFSNYPNKYLILRGFWRVFANKPLTFVNILALAVLGCLNLLAAPKIIGSFLFSLGWYELLSSDANRPNWIHADFGMNTATTALMLSLLLDCPYSFKVHAFDIASTSLKHYDLLGKIKYSKASLIFSEHKYGAGIVLQKYPFIDDKLRVNYSSIRPQDFNKLPSSPQSKRFVALGRLVYKKGFHILIEAAASLREKGLNIKIDIYGSGSEEESLSDLITSRKLESTVKLCGRYNNEALPEMLYDCLALVVPSVIAPDGNIDGVPTVIYEAMSLGRAVISSYLSGIPEVIEDGKNGLLFTPGDADQLAKKMEYLLHNPTVKEYMEERARLLVEEKHDYLLNSKKMIKCIEEAFPNGQNE